MLKILSMQIQSIGYWYFSFPVQKTNIPWIKGIRCDSVIIVYRGIGNWFDIVEFAVIFARKIGYNRPRYANEAKPTFNGSKTLISHLPERNKGL
jgi:hypothetical protein